MHAAGLDDIDDDDPAFAHSRVLDFYRAFAAGATTPDAVATRLIAALLGDDASGPHLQARYKPFAAFHVEDVRAQAAASTVRWADGAALSIWDGVPVGGRTRTNCYGCIRINPRVIGVEWPARGRESKHNNSFVSIRWA